jgi:hypothetical protein
LFLLFYVSLFSKRHKVRCLLSSVVVFF